MRSYLVTLFLLLIPSLAAAEPQQLYDQAMAMAASGHEREAVAQLHGAAAVLSPSDIWQQRMVMASKLIEMRIDQSVELNASDASMHARLVQNYLKEHQRIQAEESWTPAILATIFPGAGHAWQGRWQDAWVAAIMVWPMLILTLWAASRRMGPVTIFFAIITAWLWSGTVFSSISLAERGGVESYLLWWQGVWQASGLPGRPW